MSTKISNILAAGLIAVALAACTAKEEQPSGSADPTTEYGEPVVGFATSSFKIDPGTYTADVAVTLSWEYSSDINVTLSVPSNVIPSDGYRQVPAESVTYGTSVTVPAGAKTASVQVTFDGDDMVEGDYEFTLDIASVSVGSISRYNSRARVYGHAGYEAPVVSINEVSQTNEWYKTSVTLSLKSVFNHDIFVTLAHTGPDEGTTYKEFPEGALKYDTQVTIPAGETSVEVPVEVPDITALGENRFAYYQTNIYIKELSVGVIDSEHSSAKVYGWMGNFIHPEKMDAWKVSYVGKKETEDHYCLDFFKVEGLDGESWMALADYTDEELSERWGGRLGAIFESFANYLDFTMGVSHRTIDQIGFKENGEIAYGRLDGGLEAHMLLLEVTEDGDVTGRYAECDFTADEPFGVSTYNAWLGKWNVKAYKRTPVTVAETFDIEVTVNTVNARYNITGWQEMNVEMPIYANYNSYDHTMNFAHQDLGNVYNSYGQQLHMLFSGIVNGKGEDGEYHHYYWKFGEGETIAVATFENGQDDVASITGISKNLRDAPASVVYMGYYTEPVGNTSAANREPTGGDYYFPITLTRIGGAKSAPSSSPVKAPVASFSEYKKNNR